MPALSGAKSRELKRIVDTVKMSWIQKYQLRSFLRKSFWPMPMMAMVLALLAAPLSRWVDHAFQWKLLNFTPEGAQVILSAFVGSMLTFFVFVTSSLLVVVQLASAQMTPRIIAGAYARPIVRRSMALFVFSFGYSLTVLGRIDAQVLQLSTAIAILANLASIFVFIYFISAVGNTLRPVAVLTEVARVGGKVINEMYPAMHDRNAPSAADAPATRFQFTQPVSLTICAANSGVLLAFDINGLTAYARKTGIAIELVPSVGDFVAAGNPLFNIHGDADVDESFLQSSVAVGAERTFEQDPGFAFRVVVDIANKALSPAINDPTTAVLALDQLQRMLRWLGNRQIDDGIIRDAIGRVCLLYRTPNWEEYVSLALAEIRLYGAGSFQVARRLRELLLNLLQTLPESRRPAIKKELDALHRAVLRYYPDPEDQRLAERSDSQGLGNASEPAG